MAYPLNLAARITGNTYSQLQNLRSKGIVVPEIRPYRPPLYSFRDLVALRSIAFLRGNTSAQKITRAFTSLDLLDLTEHPSSYQLGTDGDTIYIEYEGQALDLVRRRGETAVFSFDEVTSQFTDFRGDVITPFYRPSEFVELDLGRMGGWPTVAGTRIPYDTIANLVDDDTVTAEDVEYFYPTVSAKAARDVVGFSRSVEAVA